MTDLIIQYCFHLSESAYHYMDAWQSGVISSQELFALANGDKNEMSLVIDTVRTAVTGDSSAASLVSDRVFNQCVNDNI